MKLLIATYNIANIDKTMDMLNGEYGKLVTLDGEFPILSINTVLVQCESILDTITSILTQNNIKFAALKD